MEKKYICLRDDDTNYFTEPGELAYCYGDYWGKIPVTLATIPFAHGSERKILTVENQENKFVALRQWEENATAEELSEYHHIFPIGLNTELVKELKRMISIGKVEIAQHGVCHRYTEFGAEMVGESMGFCAIRDGKEYLEKVFGQPVKVFIPPSNTIDNVCVDYIDKLGMKLLCCGSMIFSSKRTKIIKAISHPMESLDSLRSRVVRENKPIRNRGGYTITGSITYDAKKDMQDILDSVKKMLNNYGFVSITTHYRLLSNKYEMGKEYNYREKFHDLLSELCSIDNVEFIRASEYIEKAGQRFL